MALAADGAYFLGLKVGRRSLDLVLIDFVGRVEGRVHITHKFPTPEGVVRFANSAIDQLLGQLTAPQRARVSGLGIAIPFQLWDWAKPLGVKPGELAEWRDRDVAREIAENWDFPVYLKNDASAACGAELVFGEKDRPSDFLYFFIGFFVGGGLVVDNALYTGRTGNAAALGSIPLGMSGSQTRQLVDVASLASLENALIAVGGNGDMIWENPKSWSVPDAILDRWMDEACEGLAYAILSAVCLIDFPQAMIDGWLPDDIRAEIVKRTRDRVATANLAGIATPDVRSGTIGSDARSLGAASLPLSERFLVDKDAFLMR
jgi:predicted NBD/HSP70 family sugar kinase